MGVKFQYDIFLGFWWIVFGWLLILFLVKRWLADWFRLPCELKEATHVYMFRPTESEILVRNPTAVVRFSRIIFKLVKDIFKIQDGFSNTVEVEQVEIEKEELRMITFQYQRYVIKNNQLFLPTVTIA